MIKKTERVRIGSIGVDSGMCWIGDPCYVIGKDSSHGVEEWHDFCDKMKYEGLHEEPLGSGIGLAVTAGFGDGVYPVFAEISDEGAWGKRIKSITIDFISDDEEEEET